MGEIFHQFFIFLNKCHPPTPTHSSVYLTPSALGGVAVFFIVVGAVNLPPALNVEEQRTDKKAIKPQ